MSWLSQLEKTDDREKLYLRFLVDRGMVERHGFFWQTQERVERLVRELRVIETAGFSGSFVMLADVLGWCRENKIAVGPGRGSVGGCYVGYAVGIHDMDSIRWGLFFERFMNPDRISFPDIDIDISQKHRPRVIQYIVDRYSRGDQVVLQIGAFAKAGARKVVELVAAARAEDGEDGQAWAIAAALKACLPDGGSVTGGTKVEREIQAWLYGGMGHGDKERFEEIAKRTGWLDDLLKLDGVQTHVTKHAAGVVILRKEDVPNLPLLTVTDGKGRPSTMTAYDMYALDNLSYLKWDFLGLRTLDVIVDADMLAGGTGEMRDLLRQFEENIEDPRPYELLSAADTLGIFQMDTNGYRQTLRKFQPTCFEHVVQLGALYRPGAIDYRRPEDGKNMVDVFIDRMHGREPVSYDHPLLKPILGETHGVILYQEQSMRIVRDLAGFTLAQADTLRKAIGKKRPEEMAKLIPLWEQGCEANGIDQRARDNIWHNIEASARYSWNMAHAAAYGLITWLSAWKKSTQIAPFAAAEINSRGGDTDQQTYAIKNLRTKTEFSPPRINVAVEGFTVSEDKQSVVFGLNGIRGMGPSARGMLLMDRLVHGHYSSYEEFASRLPSLPSNLKEALIKCGAFDEMHRRDWLLAKVPKANSKTGAVWTIADHINHNNKLKKKREIPQVSEFVSIPTPRELAQMEKESIGYYLSKDLFKDVRVAIERIFEPVVGGEVDAIRTKNDKNGNEMAWVTLTTPDLSSVRVTVFGSNWPQVKPKVSEGRHLIFRGSPDGDGFIGNACWDTEDVRHFSLIEYRKRGEEWSPTEKFDGDIKTVRQMEAAGYQVRLL